MAAPRRVGAPLLARGAGALGSFAVEEGVGEGAVLPWDVVRAKLAELLRFLASALPALAAALRGWAAALGRWARAASAVGVPVAAAVALVAVCCCCCGYYAACGRRRRRGPDGEEAGGCDGPVVRYRRGAGTGGYKGGVFSLHPNKPIVC